MAQKKGSGLFGALARQFVVLDPVSEGEPEGQPAAAAGNAADLPAEAQPRDFTPASPAGVPAGEPAESLSLDQIYADAGVPQAPFSAERLLKVLQGLTAMDLATRRTVIAALDAADDTWKIEDVLLDADRKIKALQARKAQLNQQVSLAEGASKEAVAAREKKLQEAVASIREQMAQLQALMEREVEGATHDKKDAEAQAQAVRESTLRESAQLDNEIARLREILNTFPVPGPAKG